KESQVKTPVSVIYNGVNLDTFHPSPKRRKDFRRKYKIFDDEIIIGICSRIAPEKGHDTFVKAASLVAPENRKMRFIIAGDSVFDRNQDFKYKTMLLAKELGVDSRIVWTGFVEKTEELYSALDILVVASKAEPFGRVAIEAGACGIPVIGTACGGIPEIVQHDLTGILIPAENPVPLAHAIEELAENREKRMKLGRQATRWIAANFSLTNHVAAVEGLYFQLLGS
ncbi:MAG: glycosyltransferase family 4 protein, partial [Desulfobacterales bacterium]